MKVLSKALVLAALFLYGNARAVELESVPELATVSPITPVVTEIEAAALKFSDVAVLPAIPALTKLDNPPPGATVVVPQTAAQAAAKTATLASVENLNSQLTAPKATDGARRENLTAAFDQAQAGGAAAVPGAIQGSGVGNGDGSLEGSAPSPIEKFPEPSWPRPQARTIVFNGETYKTIMTRPDDPIAPVVEKLIKSAKKSVYISAYEFNLPELLAALRWLRENKPAVKIKIVLDRSNVYTSGRDQTGNPRKPSPEIVALIREGFDVLVLKGRRGGIMHSKFVLVDAPSSGVAQSIARAARTMGAQAAGWFADVLGSQSLIGWARSLAAKAESSRAAEEEQTGLVLRGSYNYTVSAENNHYENVEISIEKKRVKNYLNDFKYMRELAEEVDPDKLEQALSITEAQDILIDESYPDLTEPDAAETATSRRKTDPPPPESDETSIDIHGEKFKTEYFSPNGGILDAWLRGIRAAEESLDIAMFSFYSRDVADALVAAVMEKRKTHKDFRLRLVLDKGQAALARFDREPGDRNSGTRVADWFEERGIDVRLNGGPHWRGKRETRRSAFEKLHSKYMIIDGKWAFTGSWNASPRAQADNFENMTVLVDPLDVAILVWDFERIYLRSVVPSEIWSSAGIGPDSSLPLPDR